MAEYMFKRFAVTTVAGLIELDGLIHDEFFDIADVACDRVSGVAVIPLRRILHDGPERVIRKGILFRKREIDVLDAVIRIANVTGCSIVDTEKVGIYSFEEVEFHTATSELAFTASPKLRLTFVVSSLSIEYEELKFSGKALITNGLFWETSRILKQ